MKRLVLIIGTAALTACGTAIVTGSDQTSRMADEGEIVGECTLLLPGERTAGCEDVALFVRSPDDGEERRAELIGQKFIFRDLHRRSYVLNAVSSKYDLETNVKNEVSPGQTIKIRLRAKTR
jgi:hypothetical protein